MVTYNMSHPLVIKVRAKLEISIKEKPLTLAQFKDLLSAQGFKGDRLKVVYMAYRTALKNQG